MTTTTVFDKTAKGREEIATRMYQVPARMRTLLLLVDGKRDVVDLMAKVAGLGLDKKSLDELVAGQFICVQEVLEDTDSDVEASVFSTAAPNEVASITRASIIGLESVADHSFSSDLSTADVSLPVAPSAFINDGALRSGESQFQALTNFFNETIRSSIGLRGFTMQLKVERATTIADFHALREPYLHAVLKANGPELEHSLRNRLDQLLGLQS